MGLPAHSRDANFDDELIRNSVGNLFKLIEGAFGALIMAVAGLIAILAAAMGAYRAAIGMVVVAVGAFILRALVSLFFGIDFDDYSSRASFRSSGGGRSQVASFGGGSGSVRRRASSFPRVSTRAELPQIRPYPASAFSSSRSTSYFQEETQLPEGEVSSTFEPSGRDNLFALRQRYAAPNERRSEILRAARNGRAIVEIRSSEAALRRAPHPDASIVLEYGRGTQLIVRKKSDSWYEVYTPQGTWPTKGRTAYIKADKVSEVSDLA